MAFGPPGSLTSPASGAVADINTILTQEANRIGQDIHKATLHTSPWIDLIKQNTFPEGMGYTLNTLIYDRALPITPLANDLGHDPAGSLVGTNWAALGAVTASGANGFTGGQTETTASLPTEDNNVNTIDFSKVLKSYSLSRAVIESPRINVEELRYAAHRTEQLRAIMDLLKESTRQTWESRYRQQYDKQADNVVYAKASSSIFATGGEGKATHGTDVTELIDCDAAITAGGDAATTDEIGTDANLSNALLDKIYYQLVRKGAGTNAYGRENGRPVFTLVCSSEASYQLQTEAGFRDDVRYNNAAVSDLIAPLGVEKSFRGFYHLIDDMAPRFNIATADGSGAGATDNNPVEVPVYTVDQPGSDTGAGKVIMNTNYDNADVEVAYVLHQDVMESLIPAPITGAGALKFDPVNYKGDFKWTNIPDVTRNPDGTIGFFRGIMASASKPIKTDFGYVIFFKRSSSTPAAI
tara:strand:+ start:659 stop:2062 length:1404 start_codon:yes stop_codon:yes gene_type:complete